MNPFASFSIDASWTLFLDRDGVINKRIIGGYVKSPEEFQFLPEVPQSIAQLSKVFGKIVVVTNQQGIGKGLYSLDDLADIHRYMINEVVGAGGRIDAVFFAPNLASENSPLRKPDIGMALNAKKIFPQIEFSKSIMIGDTGSDMQFARNAGMKAVFCSDSAETISADVHVSSLAQFASYVSDLNV